MIFKIFLLLVIIIFHEQIFTFLSNFKLDSVKNAQKTVKKTKS